MLKQTRPFAGHIQYQPYTDVQGELRSRVQQYMDDKGLTDGAENGETLVDFVFFNSEAEGQDVYRTLIALYMDGGDAEDPSFVYVRLDEHAGGGGTDYRVYAPDEKLQDYYRSIFVDLRNCNTETFELVSGYVRHILIHNPSEAQWDALPTLDW